MWKWRENPASPTGLLTSFRMVRSQADAVTKTAPFRAWSRQRWFNRTLTV